VKKKQRYIASGEWLTVLEEVDRGPTDLPVTVQERGDGGLLKRVLAPKSKSHVVLLKERTKSRILRKKVDNPEGSSSSSGEKIPQGPDAPPFVQQINKVMTRALARGQWKKVLPDEACLIPISVETAKMAIQVLDELAAEDATAGLPREALPEGGYSTEEQARASGMPESIVAIHKELMEVTKPLRVFTPLPIQHHGTQNNLARSVIAKVPTSKLDPNSEEAELARLQKSQLRTTKKKD
jgi:hypothetical protein